jgi:hypothetical protein
LVAHYYGEAISLSSKPKSDISQKSCSQLENPISTVWAFLVLGRILRFDYLQFCLSTAELYQPLSQSIAESNNQASFSIGRNRRLKLTLLFLCTALVGGSFSWMFDSQLQEPKPTGSNMAYNG